MDTEKLFAMLVQSRKEQISGYAKYGKVLDEFAVLLKTNVENVCDMHLERGFDMPMSKASCIAMHRIFASHPKWADGGINVDLDDLSMEESQLLESIDMESMYRAYEDLGMNPSLMYQKSTADE